MEYQIRKAVWDDLPRIEEIYAFARKFMAETGNPNQWGNTTPQTCLLEDDIEKGDLYVLIHDHMIHGVFYFYIGPDPTYGVIENGHWRSNTPYGTIHRIAGDGSGGVLAAAVAFYWASRNWLSAVLLVTAVFLPWLSLLLTLPAIILGKGQLRCPDQVTLGTPAKATLSFSSRFPMPPVSGKLRLVTLSTGKGQRVKPGAPLPTGHCGAFRLRCGHFWVADYMGLIRLPVFLREDRLVLVRPIAVKPTEMPDINRYLNTVTRPKAGGGYAEIHELREYRPGDNLRQIHWKLSAKTGDLIVREPMADQVAIMH